MRSVLCALLLTTALPATADTFQLDTDVTHALITGNGGLVTYTAPVTLPAGRHKLIAHLPKYEWEASVADMRFAAPDGLRIVATSFATNKATPVDRPDSAALITAKADLASAEATLRDLRATSKALRNVTERLENQGLGPLIEGQTLPDYEP